MNGQSANSTQRKRTNILPSPLKQCIPLAALVPFLGILFFYPWRSILFLGFSRQGHQRDTCWAETVVHPVLLWHPFPRQVLIAGDGTQALVKECLRHIATTPIHWIDSTSPHIPKDIDILSRVIRHPKHSVDIFIAKNFTFDAVILDRVPSPSLVLSAAVRMAPGGVLAFILPDTWENLLIEALAAFKHVHLFTPYDSAGKSQYYAIATNSDAYAPPTHLSATYVNTLIGRRVVHKSSLQHYDGETHLRMFLLRRQIRLQLTEIYSNFANRSSTSSTTNLAPFLHENNSSSVVYPKIISQSRDFILCGRPPLSEAEATQFILKSLTNGEGISRGVLSYSWNTYQNTSTYAVPSGLDISAVKTSPVLDNSAPSLSSTPAQIIVMAIFDGGSLSFHVLPHLGLSRVSIVNSNGWVSSEDILDTLGDIQHCERSSGIIHSGPAPLIHSNTFDERLSHFGDAALGSVYHWKLDDPYWSSPKIDVRKSLLGGSGNWANAEILKDEVIFRGPVESEAIHIEEYKRYPAWKKSHMDHFGERPHEEIFSGPSKGLEDVLYFLNHACSPNIRYRDSYDVMIALRNISIGEELTFDYATSCGPGIRLECKCGAKNCRHKVTGSDWKDENLVQSLGKEAFIPYLKAKIIRMEEGIQT